jgi:tRNA 2-selenouridine synthase
VNTGAPVVSQSLPLTLDALAAFDTVIDVRSPSEYAEDHLPGALNFPVLTDEERAQVGTLHKQTSAFEAKRAGAAIVARHIAQHLERAFAEHPKSWRPLVYCWRGGLRSGAMTHVLRSVGWNARQLVGGYKAWRGQVIADLEVFPAKFSFTVVCGRTGSGKSRFLEALEETGAQVLDLEKLAAHKGSVLGDLPHAPQPSQKRLESLIWAALAGFDPARPVYVEAESKRIGNLRVPDALMQRMRVSECVEIVAGVAGRVALLREEYAHLIARPDVLFARLDCLAPLHSTARVEHWKDLARAGQWDAFVGEMLRDHYDPAYLKSMFRNFVHAEKATPLPMAGTGRDDFARLARSTRR